MEEIDHKVRYPNFSDDKLIESILQTFNRIAGSADEIGSFVVWLAESLKASSAELAIASVKGGCVCRVESNCGRTEGVARSRRGLQAYYR